MYINFFFSSRRRHTRSKRDWSSDVCSSDLTVCAFYAPHSLSENKEKHYFYTFFFFLIAAVSGAFLTGDLFNLFVFYEVLLMASYGLIVLGGGKRQLKESIKYVLINVFSSILFVTAVAFLYGTVG